MGSLATLVVQMEAQTGKYQRDLEKANAKLKKFETKTQKSVKNIRRSFVGLGAVVGAIGLGALFRSITRATSEQEQAVAQLKAGLDSTNESVGYSLDQLIKKSEELQKVTLFGDEAFIEAQSQLITFNKIVGSEFDKTLELAADLSTRFGTDLKSSVIQLGKALNDPIANLSALSRSGIQFTEVQKDMIKAFVEAGDLQKAQSVILKELETQFGGSARAARETFGGALEGLKGAFADLMEADGKSLPALKSDIESLTKTLQDEKTISAVQKLTGAMVTGISKVIGVTSKFINQLFTIGSKIDELSGDQSAEGILKSKQIDLESALARAAGGGQSSRGAQARVKRLTQEIALLKDVGVQAGRVTEKQSQLNAIALMSDSGQSARAQKGRAVRIKKELDLLKQQLSLAKSLNQTAEIGGDGGGKIPTGVVVAVEPSKATSKEFEALRQSLLSEEDAIKESYKRRKLIIEGNTEEGTERRENLVAALDDQRKQQYADLEGKELNHQIKMGSISAKWEKKSLDYAKMTAKQKTLGVLGELTALTAGSAQQSKKMFKLNKMLSLANAMLSTPEAVTGAFAFGAKIGGPVLGAAFGAAALAAQMAQVNAIRGTTFQGGGSGTTPSLAGSTPTVNSVPIVEPAPTPEATAQTQPNINVFIEGLGELDGDTIMDLIEDRFKNRDQIVISAGTAQAEELRRSA